MNSAIKKSAFTDLFVVSKIYVSKIYYFLPVSTSFFYHPSKIYYQDRRQVSVVQDSHLSHCLSENLPCFPPESLALFQWVWVNPHPLPRFSSNLASGNLPCFPPESSLFQWVWVNPHPLGETDRRLYISLSGTGTPTPTSIFLLGTGVPTLTFTHTDVFLVTRYYPLHHNDRTTLLYMISQQSLYVSLPIQ